MRPEQEEPLEWPLPAEPQEKLQEQFSERLLWPLVASCFAGIGAEAWGFVELFAEEQDGCSLALE